MLQPKNIIQLLENSVWTTEECQSLLNYLENSGNTELKNLMQQHFSTDLENAQKIDPVISERLLANIRQRIDLPEINKKPTLVRMWAVRIAAACVIGLIALTAFLLFKNDTIQPIAETKRYKKTDSNDVDPGGNKAVLTLADGSTVMLDDASNGALAEQGNTKVIKLDGKLDYKVSGIAIGEVLYNTIATPRGGQYQVKLPDGSQVWLNSASSIRFPTSFTGTERSVEITGEAYFEVSKNENLPFVVSVNGAKIQVLGTHFNVNAYIDESALSTTLLEGSIKFLKNGNCTTLKPGQQSKLTQSGQLKTINDVDVEKVVAWKNGFFDFEGSDFQTIARQLARWYDVEVIYDSKIDDLFYAEIPRNSKLSDLLKALELTGKVHFKIEGKKIIVMP